MIKITRITGADEAPRLQIEGRIVATTVGDLEAACRASDTVLLDLAGVTFLDGEGARVVRELRAAGAVVVGASPLVRELLRTPAADDAPRAAGEADAEDVLLRRLRAGEPAAFEELVRLHGGRLLAVARRMLRHDEDARDAVQEGLLSACKALPGFHGQARLSTWLHRIVVNAVLMRMRTRRRRPEASIEDLLPTFDEEGWWTTGPTPLELPADAAERSETRAIVRACIAALPDSLRTVLVLRDIEELDTDETAAALGTTVPAVKTRLHRARQALRTLLARRLGGDAALPRAS